jgi:Mg2+ and Co2+ transporter CorA
MFQDEPMTILSLAYYPVRIILNEWNIYTSLVSRYSKYYEYSISDITHTLHNDDIIDLQRWRRRSQRSQHKLTALSDFISFQLDEEPKQKRWTQVLQDIRYLQRQIEIYSMSLEQMLTVATSMVQIFDSRRSITEALHIKRLTYVALVFIPLSWVASLFSMGEGFLPGQQFFWVYFSISLPLVVLVLLLSAAPFYKLGQLYKRINQYVRVIHSGKIGGSRYGV